MPTFAAFINRGVMGNRASFSQSIEPDPANGDARRYTTHDARVTPDIVGGCCPS
jgi:hypothetical protein